MRHCQGGGATLTLIITDATLHPRPPQLLPHTPLAARAQQQLQQQQQALRSSSSSSSSSMLVSETRIAAAGGGVRGAEGGAGGQISAYMPSRMEPREPRPSAYAPLPTYADVC